MSYIILVTCFGDRRHHLELLLFQQTTPIWNIINKSINPWRYSPEEPRPTEEVAARWQYLNFSFLNRISLLLISSSYPIVLARLGGPRSRSYTSRKIF